VSVCVSERESERERSYVGERARGEGDSKDLDTDLLITKARNYGSKTRKERER
jgi:hypothetical protein